MNTSPNPTDHDTVTGYLSWDHDRLDALFLDVCRMVDDGELERAAAHYKDFADGLARHIRLEEEALFPVFEAVTGVTHGPTTVMRREHRAIELAIELMRASLASEDAVGFRRGRESLEGVLPDHNVKEERVLYPTTDRALGDKGREALVARLIAF